MQEKHHGIVRRTTLGDVEAGPVGGDERMRPGPVDEQVGDSGGAQWPTTQSPLPIALSASTDSFEVSIARCGGFARPSSLLPMSTSTPATRR